MAQRLVACAREDARRRHRLRGPGARARGRERLRSVLATLYLIFTEGYSATAGDALVRRELCSEAIRLARLVAGLAPEAEGEARGLLALLLFAGLAPRGARGLPTVALVLLADQDRSLLGSRRDRRRPARCWRRRARARTRCRRGSPPSMRARRARRIPTGRRSSTPTTRLARLDASPVVRLNRAVAVGEADGPRAGLAAADAAGRLGALDGYHLFHAARADFLRRLARNEEAARRLPVRARSVRQRGRTSLSAARDWTRSPRRGRVG